MQVNALQLPEGYSAVPLGTEQEDTPLRLCILWRNESEGAFSPLVLLRNTLDAAVLLGCLVDAGGGVHGWLEIRVQRVGTLDDSPEARREVLSNAILDQRWISYVRALETIERDQILEGGFETEHPCPFFVELSSLKPFHPVHAESGKPWRLCTDDALLIGKKLPTYSSTLHRYWHVPDLGEESPMVPVTPDAPINEGCISLKDALAGDTSAVAVNPEGGFMLVRPFHPLRLEELIDVLGGRAWAGVRNGKTELPVIPAADALKENPSEGEALSRLFLLRQGPAARFRECFHLKLKLLADALAAVSGYVERTQEPLLNLTAESFRVHFPEGGVALPLLWTARVSLAEPGKMVSVPIPRSEKKYRIMLSGQGPSVFGADLVNRLSRGTGTVRLRKVKAEPRGQTLVEGTFETQEHLDPGRNDLLWLRLPTGGRVIDLYAGMEQESSLAAGEWRFRSGDQSWSGEEVKMLKSLEGVVCRGVPFEILPQLTSPCDLYSLGVLAVRILLQNKKATLPVMLDHVISLARRVAEEHDSDTALAERVGHVLEKDPRWTKVLGPHNVLYDPADPEEARAWMPEDLWHDTLAMIIQSFPGCGPDSRCRDFSDAADGRLQEVFDLLARQVNSLLVRTRCLLFHEDSFNREIRERIFHFRR